VGVIGALVLAMFAVLFFRLWSLQVLSGDRYLAAAQGNQLRLIRVDAPRGTIVDRHGKTIVENVPGTAVKLWVSDLPKHNRFTVVRRLATLLNLEPTRLAKEVDMHGGDPLTPITVKTAVDESKVAYLYEHQADFPGVRVEQTYLRAYPQKTMLAQVLGYLGEISPSELKRKTGALPAYRGGDTIGKTGVESAYDEYLRGKPGEAQILVDSLGRQHRGFELRRAATPGASVRLTIDVGLQRAAERALRFGIATAHENESYQANGGAIVALDPRDGAVLAMASYPTYNPSIYVGRLNPKKVARLLEAKAAERANYPAFNRVTQVAYPPGSTWKPVVALAAMQEHLLSPNEAIQCSPVATYGRDKQEFKNWNPYVNEPMRLIDAIAESCDTYFYEVGNRFYNENRTRMQEWAERFGFGSPTGIDVGWEQETLVPTPEWRKRHFDSDWDRAWNPGDSIQLAIGQKDVTVTPLQMARFYAMIANGGKLVTPYVVSDVEEPGANGQAPVVKQTFAPDPPRPSIVDPYALRVVQDGLYAATHARDGTSSGTFGTYPIPIAGKTGTAEKVVPLPGYPADHLEDQAWWCGYGPSDEARIVVCAVIENGGHGGTSAAPAAMKVFERFFGVKGKPSVAQVTD
jgi:penicillin-binding protein 2